MKNFYFFGDSYLDAKMYKNDSHYINDIYYLWPYLIESKYESEYNFKNFSKAGTGPHFAFKIFNRMMFSENKIKKNDIVLFHLSGGDRIDFICSDEIKGHLNQICFDYDERKSYCMIEKNSEEIKNEKSKKLLTFYENFKNEIDFCFLTFENDIIHMNIKYISFLYSLSKLYGIRIILFSTDKIDKFHKFSSLNDENFFISDHNLFDLSFDEILDAEKHIVANKVKIDKRLMHFSEENHYIMAEYISNIIDKKNNDLPVFKRNFKPVSDVFSYISNNKNRKFIYE